MSDSKNSDNVDGSYFGTTENMTLVETKRGVSILKCLYCKERFPKNWGKAKKHTCGKGEEVEGVGCCDDPFIEDYWEIHEQSETRTSKERKKKCTNCEKIHPLSVTKRAKDSEQKKPEN